MPRSQPLAVGHEQVVPDQLHAVADGRRQRRPPRPVVLRHPVLDGHDGVALHEVDPELRHLLGAECPVLTGQLVGAVAVQLARGGIEGDGDVLARCVAGPLDGFHEDADGVLVAVEVRGEAALVPDRGRQAASRAGPSACGTSRRPSATPPRSSAAPTGMTMNSCRSTLLSACTPAVDDVHHRHRQHMRVGTAHVAVEGQLELGRGRMGHGQRHAEQGVGAQPSLVVGAVEGDQLARRPAAGRARRDRRSCRQSRRSRCRRPAGRPCPRSGRRRRGARRPRARRWTPPRGRWRGRWRRCRDRRPPRRSGCRANRGPRALRSPRSRSRRQTVVGGGPETGAPSAHA